MPEPILEMPAELRALFEDGRREPSAGRRCGSGAATRRRGASRTTGRDVQGDGRARRRPRIQAKQEPDLAVRWNCKAGQVRIVQRGDQRPAAPHVHDAHDAARRRASRSPSRRCAAFPIIRDLVTDVSFNFEMAKKVPPFKPRPRAGRRDGYRMQQEDIDRIQEFRKCIECFLCQDVCHVIRDHDEQDALRGAALLHPPGRARHAPARHARPPRAREGRVQGSASATSPSAAPRCAPSTSRSPTTRIIPLKERVVGASYDPVAWIGRVVLRRKVRSVDDAAVQPAP